MIKAKLPKIIVNPISDGPRKFVSLGGLSRPKRRPSLMLPDYFHQKHFKGLLPSFTRKRHIATHAVCRRCAKSSGSAAAVTLAKTARRSRALRINAVLPPDARTRRLDTFYGVLDVRHSSRNARERLHVVF